MSVYDYVPPELSHLSESELRMIFGRNVHDNSWVQPTVDRYNEVTNWTQNQQAQTGYIYDPVANLQPIQQQGHYSPTGSSGSAPAASGTSEQYQRPEFTPTSPGGFEGTMPSPQLMSMEEMMDIVNRRADLAYDSQISARERALEEEMLSGERRRGEVEAGYDTAKEDLRKAAQGFQRDTSETMRRRNIYDSGLAAEMSNRIYQSMLQSNMNISMEQARVLADLAEYLDLRTRHSNEEIQQLMGDKALFAESLLDEMHMRQQDRRDMLAQQEFENWLAQQHYQLSHEYAQREEYWREVGFDAGMSQDAYNRYWDQVNFDWQRYTTDLDQYRWETEFGERRNQAAFDRIMAMNRFEAEQEFNRIAHETNMSQWEADYTLRLDDFGLKTAIYRAQFG